MANEPISQNFPQNPDLQSEGVSGDVITHPQEQPRLPDKPPKSLLDWLVRVHLRLMTIEPEKTEDSN
jgi:hypothetical protein